MGKKHGFLKAAATVAGAASVGIIAAGNHFYKEIFSRDGRPFEKYGADYGGDPALAQDKGYRDFVENAREWRDGTDFEEVSATSLDGVRLKAAIAESKSGHKWVITVHGYGDSGMTMYRYMYMFSERGFSILSPDCRGHGKSGGRYIGMGWHDRLDIICWIRFILKRDPDAEIVLFGSSMGAAAVMMASGENLPESVKCIVEDGGYTTAREAIGLQFRRIYDLPADPLIEAMNLVLMFRAGYSLHEASSLAQVEKSRTPILFISGGDDRMVPQRMTKRLYEACASEKEILTVPGAGHGLSHAVDREKYLDTVFGFVGRYMDVD